MRGLPVLAVTVLLAGCAWYRPAAGVRETIQQPLHTETGAGITVWKIPIIGIGGWGFPWWYSYGGLPVIEYNYNYQAVPPVVPQGGVPAQPPGAPASVSYQNIYSSRPFDDPTLVILRNGSDRARLTVTIDDGEPIVLAPGQITTNLNLDIGDHQAKVRGEVPTTLGSRPIPERIFPLRIDPRGRSQIIYLSEF